MPPLGLKKKLIDTKLEEDIKNEDIHFKAETAKLDLKWSK